MKYVLKILLVFVLMICLTTSCDQSYRTSEGFIEFEGAELYYKTMGKGEPILFVHGGPGLHHGYFLPHVKSLADEHKLVFYDQRSCGKSSAPADSSSMTILQFVEDLEAIRKELALEKVHLLGHSWGGLPAMTYATTYPEHCKSLVLVNSVSPYARVNEQEMKVLADRMNREDSLKLQQILTSTELKEGQSAAYEELLKTNLKSQFSNAELLDSLHLNLPEDFSKKYPYFNNMSRELQTYDYREELKGLTVPTLVLCGDYDPLTMAVCPELKELIPNAKYEVLENTGHFPFVETPATFHDAVLTFTQEVEPN